MFFFLILLLFPPPSSPLFSLFSRPSRHSLPFIFLLLSIFLPLLPPHHSLLLSSCLFIFRQLDTREPHSCSDEGCRNVLIDLKLTCGAMAGSTQCKCISINPTRPEQIAVGAMDPYARIYDTRVCSLRRSAKQEVQYGDPSCLAHFAPGHISNSCSGKTKKHSTLATTYLSFSPDGRELLVNLSGEHIYLYNVLHYQEALKYEFVENTESYSYKMPPTFSHRDGYQAITTMNGVRRSGDLSVLTHCSSQDDNHVVRSKCDVSQKVQKLKEKALEFHSNGKYAEAVNVFSTAIRLCPNWHVLYHLRAVSFYKRKW